MMCQVLGVSPSGYSAWVGRKPSARRLADAALTARIKKIHEESRATYGNKAQNPMTRPNSARSSRRE
jgi:putative transposase